MTQTHIILLRIRSHRGLYQIPLQWQLHLIWIIHIHTHLQCTLLLIKQKRLQGTIRTMLQLLILHNMALQLVVLQFLHPNQIILTPRNLIVLVLHIQDTITQHTLSHKVLHVGIHLQLNTTHTHDIIIAVILLQLLRTINILHVPNLTQMHDEVDLVKHPVQLDLMSHQIPRYRRTLLLHMLNP